MKTATRRAQILQELQDGDAHYLTLSEKFSVSEATIRRDLRWLADHKGVTRTYGGALVAENREVSVAQRSLAERGEKHAIARSAAELIQPGDCVLLDAGTTAGALATQLRSWSGITVVTNGVNAMQELADSEVELIMLGGSFRAINQALVGPMTEENLSRFRFDWAFLGADSLDPTEGIGCISLSQAYLKGHMAGRSAQVAVLADYTKLAGRIGQYRAPLAQHYTLITDSGADSEELARYKGLSEVTVAQVDESI